MQDMVEVKDDIIQDSDQLYRQGLDKRDNQKA